MNKLAKSFVKIAFAVLVTTSIFISCQDQDEFILPALESAKGLPFKGNQMKLGKQLENPYSIENMRKALANLRANGRTTGDFDIETTDLYIRFMPADSLEYDIIASDTTIELFDHPLDFEVEQEGNWYHDPSVPDHLPTYQYCVVKPNHIFPNTIKYEILAELFIPEELDNNTEEGSRIESKLDFLYALEDEALRITNNWEEPIGEELGSNVRTSRWNPSGRVRVMEQRGGTNRNWLPVENIKVRVRRWFTVKTDYTDSNGNYKVNHRFRRSVNYSIKFETPYAKISNYLGWDTKHDGPKIKGDWNVDFNWHSESWVRATLINSIVEYRVQYHRTGIKNPYPISYWAGGEAIDKINVRAVFDEGTGNHWPLRTNVIKIFTEFTRGRGNKETDDLYSIAFHELGHQSHWKLNRWNITWSNKIMRESWASYIEHIFIQQYYPNYPTHKQSEDKNDMSDGYSAIFIDLADNNNQRTRNNGNINFPNDNVQGYTPSQMQSAVKTSRRLEHVRDYLRDNYDNGTESNLNDLFDFYIDIQ